VEPPKRFAGGGGAPTWGIASTGCASGRASSPVLHAFRKMSWRRSGETRPGPTFPSSAGAGPKLKKTGLASRSRLQAFRRRYGLRLRLGEREDRRLALDVSVNAKRRPQGRLEELTYSLSCRRCRAWRPGRPRPTWRRTRVVADGIVPPWPQLGGLASLRDEKGAAKGQVGPGVDV